MADRGAVLLSGSTCGKGGTGMRLMEDLSVEAAACSGGRESSRDKRRGRSSREGQRR